MTRLGAGTGDRRTTPHTGSQPAELGLVPNEVGTHAWREKEEGRSESEINKDRHADR